MRDLLNIETCEAIELAALRLGSYPGWFRKAEELCNKLGVGGYKLRAYAAATEELIRASKGLLQAMRDCGETTNEDGEETNQVAAVRQALDKFGVKP